MAAIVIAATVGVAPAVLDAQVRGAGQGRAGGRGQMAQRGGLSPADIQAQFDQYVIGQAEGVLLIADEQRPQFVRRVRALQAVRRQARVARNRLLAEMSQLLRGRGADEERLAAATRDIDAHEHNTLANVQKAYAAIDEVLTPWQRARFRVLEDQLEQKKIDMLARARQGPRR
jgi:Spy/CpxP family protein refolding chaperone